MNILTFQVRITLSMTFPDFSIPKVIFHYFPDLENFYFKFHDFPDFSRICTNPDSIKTVTDACHNCGYKKCMLQQWMQCPQEHQVTAICRLHTIVICKLPNYGLQLEIGWGGGCYSPLLNKREQTEREG